MKINNENLKALKEMGEKAHTVAIQDVEEKIYKEIKEEAYTPRVGFSTIRNSPKVGSNGIW